jgi:uncharacterized protein (DUF58 family)
VALAAHLPAGPLTRRFGRWLDRRIPPAPAVTLSQRNIFIFPSATGFAFGGLLALLVLAAINYQASLVYAVAFLLGSLFLVTILHTFRNLSGLRLEFVSGRAGFAGEEIELAIRVARPAARGLGGNRAREGIQLGFPNSIPRWVDLHGQEADLIRLYVPAERRGYLHPGRLLVETYYPLGLLRAWTWVDLDVRALVYPRPVFGTVSEAEGGRRDDGELIDPQGSEDFVDIKAYRPGDPVRHIMWRSFARGEELMVKHYASFMESRLWLDLERVPGDVEERLSRLAGLALQANRSGREFGLRLGATEVKPSLGEAHLERVLRELALHGHR